LPLESVDAVNTTGNQEQAAAVPRRERLISVPSRPAAWPTRAAQTPRSGVCHQSGAAKPGWVLPLWWLAIAWSAAWPTA